MTGRSVHDALLRVLASAELRRVGRADARGLGAALGTEEAAVLACADRERLEQRAQFGGSKWW